MDLRDQHQEAPRSDGPMVGGSQKSHQPHQNSQKHPTHKAITLLIYAKLEFLTLSAHTTAFSKLSYEVNNISLVLLMGKPSGG